MEKLDNLLKLEKILNLISESVKTELEDFKTLKKGELEDFKRKKEEEFKSKKEAIQREFEKEREKLLRLHESKKALLLSQERSRLKSEMFSMVKQALEKFVEELEGEDRKRYLLFLFNNAKEKISGNYRVLCREKDVKLVKEFFNGEVRASDVDGIVLESGNMRVMAGMDTLLEKMEDEVMRLIDEKVGGLK